MGGGSARHLLLRPSLRLQPSRPPLPRPPPPPGIVANTSSRSLGPRVPARTPDPLPLPGRASAVAGARERPAPPFSPRKCGLRAGKRGARRGGEGRRCGRPLRAPPGPGLFWVPRGRGRARLLRAFVESQLSQRKGPRDPVTRESSHFTVRAGEVPRGGLSWKSFLEDGALAKTGVLGPLPPFSVSCFGVPTVFKHCRLLQARLCPQGELPGTLELNLTQSRKKGQILGRTRR